MKTLIYYKNRDSYNYCLYIDYDKKTFDEYGTGYIVEYKDTIYIKTGLRDLKKTKEKLIENGYIKGYVIGKSN